MKAASHARVSRLIAGLLSRIVRNGWRGHVLLSHVCGFAAHRSLLGSIERGELLSRHAHTVTGNIKASDHRGDDRGREPSDRLLRGRQDGVGL
jgi:hypothetical protein